MKILTVVYDLDKGGTQRVAQNFAEAYRELNHDSRILSLYGLGCRYEEVKDIIVVYQGIDSIEEMVEWQPDLIHIHSHGAHAADIEKILNACKDSRVIETNVFSIPSPWAQLVDCSFQLSIWANWIFNIRGGKKYNSSILPNPLKTEGLSSIDKTLAKNEFCKKYQIDPNAQILGRIGQSFNGKWSDYLVEAFNDLKKGDELYHLVVVNPPEVILKAIDKSPFKNAITVIDHIIGDALLQEAYAAFDLTIHIAEQGESFGMIIAESILSGTPVVTLSTPWGDNSQLEVIGLEHKDFLCVSIKQLKSKISWYFTLTDVQKQQIVTAMKNGIIERYDRKKLAMLALSEETLHEKFDIRNFNKIKNGIHHDLLTDWLIETQSDFLRKFTMVTSGYYPWYRLPIILMEKVQKRISKIKS